MTHVSAFTHSSLAQAFVCSSWYRLRWIYNKLQYFRSLTIPRKSRIARPRTDKPLSPFFAPLKEHAPLGRTCHFCARVVLAVTITFLPERPLSFAQPPGVELCLPNPKQSKAKQKQSLLWCFWPEAKQSKANFAFWPFFPKAKQSKAKLKSKARQSKPRWKSKAKQTENFGKISKFRT